MSKPSAKTKVTKPDKATKLRAELGDLSIDIRLTQAHLQQLNQKYAEVYQSLQQIKSTPAKPATDAPEK